MKDIYSHRHWPASHKWSWQNRMASPCQLCNHIENSSWLCKSVHFLFTYHFEKLANKGLTISSNKLPGTLPAMKDPKINQTNTVYQYIKEKISAWNAPAYTLTWSDSTSLPSTILYPPIPIPFSRKDWYGRTAIDTNRKWHLQSYLGPPTSKSPLFHALACQANTHILPKVKPPSYDMINDINIYLQHVAIFVHVFTNAAHAAHIPPY